jgi:hypothetical protein
MTQGSMRELCIANKIRRYKTLNRINLFNHIQPFLSLSSIYRSALFQEYHPLRSAAKVSPPYYTNPSLVSVTRAQLVRSRGGPQYSANFSLRPMFRRIVSRSTGSTSSLAFSAESSIPASKNPSRKQRNQHCN